jgi:hypothetical protein
MMTKHGMHKTSEYHAWHDILERCHNPNNKNYFRYGARGITVYQEWKKSFETFYGYIGPKPTPKHTLERINNNAGYLPGNIKWATQKEQMRNMSRNRYITLNGVTRCVSEWAEVLKINKNTIKYRLRKGMPPEKALAPVGIKGKRV